MDIRRVVLFAALALIGHSLWTNWQADYPEKKEIVQPKIKSSTVSKTNSQLLPNIIENDSTISIEHKKDTAKDTTKTVHVKTDVLDVSIDLEQGDIVQTQLLNYPESVSEQHTPFVLLQNEGSARYVANSNLFVVKENKTTPIALSFASDNQQYEMNNNQKEIIVSLTGQTTTGLFVKKEFIFKRGDYLIQVRYTLANQSLVTWKGYMNTQLLRSSPTEDKSSMFHVGSYTGASYAKPGVSNYKKVSFSDMAKSNLDLESDGGWIAMQQHYFLTAWIPEENSKNKFYTRFSNGTYTIGAVSLPIVIPAGQQKEVATRLYLGPEITSQLKTIAKGLDLTVDYGWLWFISALLFSLMKTIYTIVGNWGWSIVLVTVLIKLAFYRLSAKSFKSMAGMRKLQPKLLALRERFGDDKAKISQATMELYRQEKVNPLGGCLPILVQIPVFIALYWVLLESVELRQAPFIFWITDLSSADSFHILPIMMGATMLIQQKLNPAPPDPMQAKVMMFLPILFTGLFWSFPAGLVLYWVVNNSLSILQQWYITRKYGDDKPTKPKKIVPKLTVVK